MSEEVKVCPNETVKTWQVSQNYLDTSLWQYTWGWFPTKDGLTVQCVDPRSDELTYTTPHSDLRSYY